MDRKALHTLGGRAFIAAALVHFDLLIGGYEHQRAGTAESVIAVVLLVGLALKWICPRSIGRVSLAAQAFAALETLGGIFTTPLASVPAQHSVSSITSR